VSDLQSRDSDWRNWDDQCRDGSEIIAHIDRCHDPRHAYAGLRRRITRGAQLLIDGWIVDRGRGRPPLRLLFLVDGMPFFLEEGLSERKDVGEYYDAQTLCRCGFTTILPTDKVSNGMHQLAVCSIFDSSSALPPPFELGSFNVVDCDVLDMPVTQTGAIAAIDDISVNGRTVQRTYFNVNHGERLAIVGWAIDELRDALPAAVFIELNQSQRFEALVGIERPDVGAHFRNEHYRYSGYSCEIDTTSLQEGHYRGDVRIVMEGSTVAYTAFAHFEFAISS
jgi:hypothetical protein